MSIYVSTRSTSCVRIRPDSYVIKPYKRNEKIRIYYVCKLCQNYVMKITSELRQEVVLDLRFVTT